VYTNRWSDFKIAKYKAQLESFENGTRLFAPYRLHETHRIEGLCYCDNDNCKYGQMFVDRDVTAARSIHDGLLAWLRCAPPPTHMRRGGQNGKAPPLPEPAYLHYNEEKHWYTERRLPLPKEAPQPEEEEEKEEEEGLFPVVDNTDEPEIPVPEPEPVKLDLASMSVDQVPLTSPQDNSNMRAALAQVAANTALLIKIQESSSAAMVDAINTLGSTVSSSTSNIVTAINTGLTSINATLHQLLGTVLPSATSSQAASQSQPSVAVNTKTSTISTPMTVGLNDNEDVDMHIVQSQTTQVVSSVVTTTEPSTITSVSAVDPTMTTTTTTGPVSTTTVTTTGPTSTTTTTTIRRRSAVSVPTYVSNTILGTGIQEQASVPMESTMNGPQQVSAESTEQQSSSNLNGGPASMAPQAIRLIGNNTGQVQVVESEEKTRKP